MFEWLNNLEVGDEVVIRDNDYNRLGQFPTIEFVEVVIEVTDKHFRLIGDPCGNSFSIKYSHITSTRDGPIS